MKYLLAFVAVSASVLSIAACGGSSSPKVNLSDCTIANAPTLAAQYGHDLPKACKQKINNQVDGVSLELKHWQICSNGPLEKYDQCMIKFGDSPNGA
jgi:hypothetical protein